MTNAHEIRGDAPLGGGSSDSLAPDLLRGGSSIASFLFGDAGSRRQVYHLVETSKLPVFRLGSTLCARRSVLLRWITDQEQRNDR